MADFCSCGSIKLNERCTNKNCTVKLPDKPDAVKRTASSKKSDEPKKATKTRRASKCITYNMYDIKEEESAN